MLTLAWIPGLPLASFAVLILFGRRLTPPWAGWLSVAALAGSCALWLSLAPLVLSEQHVALSWAWLPSEDPAWALGFVVDGMSWLMLGIVTIIGTMIQLYSIGYMRDEARFSRFFAYLSLFCASMLGLVLADHLLLFFVCWELMGLCSYLLISFWFEKPTAAEAGRKAFITTRLGDAGLLLGILLLAAAVGELHFDQFHVVRLNLLLQHHGTLLSAISLLIFLGAVGKSAQIPLHVWLPDAMEGPTPVSALIHAATMVAAGVYLVARAFPLFTPTALQVVLVVGLATHLFAGTVALTMTDIKRVLAYSTISQLGLMMTALGLGAMPMAMFHLTTHAFFKALMFLGAGSVIHATHQQEVSRLGGLFRTMPWTAGTFLIGALAMSGAPPLSGFWSKDAILMEAQRGHAWVLALLSLGALMTACYVFRLYLLCFHGPSRVAHGADAPHPHESPWIMVGPLAVLSVGAALVGLLGSPLTQHWFFRLLGAREAREGVEPGMIALSLVLAGGGLWLARQVAVRRNLRLPAPLAPLGAWLYALASHKYFVDEAYHRWIVTPFLHLTQRLSTFDRQVIDGAVDGAGRAGWSLGQLKERFDRNVVDRAVNRLAAFVQACSSVGRKLQTGCVHDYLLAVVSGVVVVAIWLKWLG